MNRRGLLKLTTFSAAVLLVVQCLLPWLLLAKKVEDQPRPTECAKRRSQGDDARSRSCAMAEMRAKAGDATTAKDETKDPGAKRVIEARREE